MDNSHRFGNFSTIQCIREKPSKTTEADTLCHNYSVWDEVYQPGEDSFLFIDALQADLEYINDKVDPLTVVEIGPGSGILTCSLALMLTQR